MFADVIFVSMSKSHHRNDTVDQQERVRRLRSYLPRESTMIHHHRFGRLTLWRSYIIAMLRVHHYIVSPVTMFRVLWRTDDDFSLESQIQTRSSCGFVSEKND
jgi:hypothetical protein